MRNGARCEANEEKALNGVFKDVEDMRMADKEAREVGGWNGETAARHGGEAGDRERCEGKEELSQG